VPLSNFEKRKLRTKKALVFDREARLLWISPGWSEERTTKHAQRMLGDGWTEFVAPRDLAHVQKWLKGRSTKGISFCALAPETGRFGRVHWVKTRHGDHWLIIGAESPGQVNCTCAETEFRPPTG
jgi:hypothetical protein